MLKRIWLPLVLLTASQFPLMAQTDSMHFRSIVANTPSTNSCSLVKSATDLEARLKKLGWKNKGADFPDIDWKTNIAAVVTTSDSYGRPQGVNLSADKALAIIHLDAETNEHNSGVFVIELGPRFANVKDCSAQYKSLAAVLQSDPDTGKDSRADTTTSSSSSSQSSSDQNPASNSASKPPD